MERRRLPEEKPLGERIKSLEGPAHVAPDTGERNRVIAEPGGPKVKLSNEQILPRLMDAIRPGGERYYADQLLRQIDLDALSDEQLRDIIIQFKHSFSLRSYFELGNPPQDEALVDIMSGYALHRFVEELKRRTGEKQKVVVVASIQRIERPSAAVENVFAPPASETQVSRARDSQETNPSEDTSLFARARRWLGL